MNKDFKSAFTATGPSHGRSNVATSTGPKTASRPSKTTSLDKATIPPVNAFWSITLYDQEGFQVANSLNRFAVSSWMPFQYSPDGSLDLYFQNETPGAEKEANWLPAPKGPFNGVLGTSERKVRLSHRQGLLRRCTSYSWSAIGLRG